MDHAAPDGNGRRRVSVTVDNGITRIPLGAIKRGEPMLSSARVEERLARRTLALVLAGGRGSRLHQLTDRRAKPAVFFGGKFRIIDFALSNCLNSNIRRIAVLTQYKAHSLLRHLQMGWSFLRPEMNEFLDLLPAQQRLDEATWYRGTADAVYQNFDILRAAHPEFFIVLAGDHIYKMDYSNMLADLGATGADCSVACVEVPIGLASDFGIMAVNASMRIVDFLEKPMSPPSLIGKPDRALASMGIYAFSADFLYSELQRDHDDPKSSHDFGKDVIPNLVSRGLAAAHRFEDSCVTTTPDAEPYWRDVGTIDAYWAANLDLVTPVPHLDIYDPNWPIWTYQQQLPPSLLFSNVRVNSYAHTSEAVVLPEVDIGRRARLTKVVVDRGCHIPEGLVVGEDPALDAMRFARSDGGVVLITADMLAAV